MAESERLVVCVTQTHHATPLSLTRETRDNEIRVLSLTGARLNVERIPVEISLLLQKVEQL